MGEELLVVLLFLGVLIPIVVVVYYLGYWKGWSECDEE